MLKCFIARVLYKEYCNSEPDVGSTTSITVKQYIKENGNMALF